ncbi:hypothetical protein K466DRAFT_586165 [Polyporus arcularius HHB13444]|uniref:Uncharacterized protein n=1 Tax=Polyporus arcularius HHB13444 TaxID=1314778 RepID=A0A5C3PDP3_9APHY|nr:hypothetical protein K466DRAFT_586165 [Polyporus arcularius HHB13444]
MSRCGLTRDNLRWKCKLHSVCTTPRSFVSESGGSTRRLRSATRAAGDKDRGPQPSGSRLGSPLAWHSDSESSPAPPEPPPPSSGTAGSLLAAGV